MATAVLWSRKKPRFREAFQVPFAVPMSNSFYDNLEEISQIATLLHQSEIGYVITNPKNFDRTRIYPPV